MSRVRLVECGPDDWSIVGVSRRELTALAVALHEFDRPGGVLAQPVRAVRDVIDREFVTGPVNASRRAGAS